jgi:uncharacterized repeat protein (TIGR03803 family)
MAVAAMVFTLASGCWAAPQTKILNEFKASGDGMNPAAAGVTADAQGNLYGVTMNGGDHGGGTVYRLTPEQNGTWSETLLYSFLSTKSDGVSPMGSPVFDKQGNLYGATVAGGPTNDGTVYELTPTSSGPWQETILYSFNCHTAHDGCSPDSALIFDQDGSLYGETKAGTCPTGGETSCGIAFELSPHGESWTESIMHQFAAGFDKGKKEGSVPTYGLILDKDGDIYGVCQGGGQWTWGNVWQLTPLKNGKWKETILWQFGPAVDNPPKGGGANSPLLMDTAGNLYGAAVYGGGGAGGGGVIYEVSPASIKQ